MKINPALRLSLVCAVFLPVNVWAQVNNPVLPAINVTNIFNITNYGASTSLSDNSAAISNAISAASAATSGGTNGGTVEIPAGVFLSGPIIFKNYVNLQVDAGATLRMLAYGTYPGGTTPPDFITAPSLHDLEISGSGTIDGQATTSGWWKNPTLSTSARPYLIYFNKCLRVLFQGVTLKNAPKQHIAFKNWMGNVTIKGITISTPLSPNTDGIDFIGTNSIIQDCSIADGDDNIAIGSSTANAWANNIVITNCVFGHGHGLSLGSNTADSISNLTVINCVWTSTDFGIRMKSDDLLTGGGGEGGIAQGLNYYNLAMTNVGCPLLIFSYYATPDSQDNNYYPPFNDDITPLLASTQAIGTLAIPVWQNIVISNLTAVNCGESLIWGRIEAPVTNVTLVNFKTLSGFSESSYNFGIYNAYGINFINSSVSTVSGLNTFTLYNAGVTISNSSTASAVSLDGLSANNSLALYNAPLKLGAGDLYGLNPLSVSGGTLTDSNSLTLGSTNVVNFTLGSTPATVAVTGTLELDSPTLNIATNSGFGAGTYTLFSYTSSSSSITPVLGTTPSGFNYALTNNTSTKQVNLLVISTNVVSGTQPGITNQPAGQNLYVGDTARFNPGVGGSTPLFYQWYFNTNTALSGAVNPSLMLTNVQTTNSGVYSFIVTNAYGSATSAVANLSVILPPSLGNAMLNSGNLVVNGNGGQPGSNYVVVASTNVALPLNQWTPVVTNQFNGVGNYNFSAGATNPQSYFRLQFP